MQIGYLLLKAGGQCNQLGFNSAPPAYGSWNICAIFTHFPGEDLSSASRAAEAAAVLQELRHRSA